MRNALSKSLIALSERQKFVFVTGDLGFMALEGLREKLGPYFLNAGISEQNMVSVAAGVASENFPCWVYSIAPFVYARPFEQIRNDICNHKLNVKLIGNGGGYGYGVMGSTHHALEDYGILLTLPHMKIFIPAFSYDIEPSVSIMSKSSTPSYFRLGRCEAPTNWRPPAYQAWRKADRSVNLEL